MTTFFNSKVKTKIILLPMVPTSVYGIIIETFLGPFFTSANVVRSYTVCLTLCFPATDKVSVKAKETIYD